MMMELRDFQFLEAVADTGSVTRAADRLGCVQSNVTTRLKKLEGRLGQKLVERIDGRMVPTAAGQLALDYGGRIQRLAAEAEGQLRAAGEAWPPVRLGVMETTAAVRLPPLLKRVRMDMPGLRLGLHTGTSGDLMADLRRGTLDLAFVAEDAADPRFEAAPLWDEHLVEVRGTGEDVDAALVVFREGCSYRERGREALGDRPLMELGTLDGIIGCVAAGLGVTLLPEAAVERWVRLGEITTHALPPEQAHVRTLAQWRRGSPAERSIEALVAAVREG
ncbi:LysR family transcriptional regulator [Azorhizobium oxalatiphilum]|uniref:LysR family transcriptional regulator n=1 Tax=Azorhizobium oxalatiphilum TaxID=980631 RepID=A0A917BMC7_9HYPH|nr:LysR family transcriptional regulator [Azorhizobium oxalatiphilum]GGF49487.1 LysR family transcriptional regulator [Azorhizobium oxalatiphilum]